MFWLTTKIYCGDPWFRKLPPEGIIVFGACTVFTHLRTDLPGLLHTTPVALAECFEGLTLEFVKLGIMQLCLPDKNGLQHFFFDADARVIRIPHMPDHQKAANENVIRGWYRRWRDVPDCRLKFDHIESLSHAIRRPDHEVVWSETFGRHLPGSKPAALVQPGHTSSVPKQTASVTPPTGSGSDLDPDPDPVCVSDSVSVSVSVGGGTHGKHTNVVEFPQKAKRGVNSDGTRSAQLRGAHGEHAGVAGSGGPEPASEESGGGEPSEIAKGPRTLGGNILPPGYE